MPSHASQARDLVDAVLPAAGAGALPMAVVLTATG
jgi:hypothetical protein